MSIIYLTLFSLSNLGGLYTFLVLFASIILLPIIDKLFHNDIVKLYKTANKMTMGILLVLLNKFRTYSKY
jgi:hypothetical protein